jgi:hypothetical protein
MATNPARVAQAVLGGAAISTALISAVVGLISAPSYSDFRSAFLAIAVWYVLVFVLTSAVAATLGLAWHAMAMRRGWTSVHAYWAPGLIAGLFLPFMIIGAPAIMSGSDASVAFVLWSVGSVCGAALGALTGLFAWCIRRPDLDAPDPPTSAP